MKPPSETKELIPVGKPEINFGHTNHEFIWQDLGVKVVAERITQDGHAELYFYHVNSTSTRLLHMGAVNLLSNRLSSDLERPLFKHIDNLDWTTIITYVVLNTMQQLRKGEPVLDMDAEPDSRRVEYLLNPILAKGQPTTIFAPGGTGKSVMADYIAVLVQFGVPSLHELNIVPCQANVLFLDWEADINIHRKNVRAIKLGLEIESKTMIRYRFCDHSLSAELDTVRKIVETEDIGLVILDSQMAATAGENHYMSDAQIQSAYYNNLRSLRCTTLTIDHVTKVDMFESETSAPFGSVVKYNRSRSQFELKQTQEPGEDCLEWALVHRKFNLGKKLLPIGIHIDFINNEDDEIVRIDVKKCNLADNATLVKTLPKWQQIEVALKNNSEPMTSEEIQAATSLTAKDVNNNLSQYSGKHHKKQYFVKLDSHKWGLACLT